MSFGIYVLRWPHKYRRGGDAALHNPCRPDKSFKSVSDVHRSVVAMGNQAKAQGFMCFDVS